MKRRYVSVSIAIGVVMLFAGGIIAQGTTVQLTMPAAGTTQTVAKLRELIRTNNSAADFMILNEDAQGAPISSQSAYAAGWSKVLDDASTQEVTLESCPPALFRALVQEGRLPSKLFLQALPKTDPYFSSLKNLTRKYRGLLVNFQITLKHPATGESKPVRFFLVDPHPAKIVRIAGKGMTVAALNIANNWK